MRRLIAFNLVTLDGYFSGENGDISWHGRVVKDPQWTEFSRQNARGGGALVFGRITYELMASFWPTPAAAELDSVVAERMNTCRKIVFSRTLEKASWSNTELIKGNPVAEMLRLKKESKLDMAILGSGSIISQLAPHGLIDEYRFVVVPVVLGKGRTVFEGVSDRISLQLSNSRVFKNGSVSLCYKPANAR